MFNTDLEERQFDDLFMALAAWAGSKAKAGNLEGANETVKTYNDLARQTGLRQGLRSYN